MKNELLEKLEEAKKAAAALDDARQALPDSAPDAEFAAANKAYFAALDVQGKAQQEYNRSISTPAQIAAQAEQAEAQRAQLAAHLSLAEKDSRASGIPKTQAQWDADEDRREDEMGN